MIKALPFLMLSLLFFKAFSCRDAADIFYHFTVVSSDMACADEKGCFTLSWDIENFSVFLHSDNGVLTSPAFKTEIDGESALWWFLSINPSKSNIRINLNCLNERGIPENCEVTFMSSSGEILQKSVTDKYTSVECSVENYLLSSKEMHSKISQDTLILECKMWQKMMKNGAFRIHSVVEKVDFQWNILELTQNTSFQKMTTAKDTLLVMDLNLKRSKDQNYDVCVIAQPVIEGCFSFVICNIIWRAFDVRTEHEGWFNLLRTEWKKSNVFKNIVNAEYFVVIKLESIVAYHKNVQNHITHPTSSHIVRTRSMPKEVIGLEPLCEDLLHLYREGILSDATLRNEGKSFSAHRSILTARSPVFRAMFEKDETTESQSGVVKIEDVDHETMDRMLVFLYSASLEGVQWEEASKLYYAADKYDVQSLKHRCRDILIAGLTINNACEALVLADRHSDEDLMASIVDFIGKHAEVISSKTWAEMEENNLRIAAKVTRELYLRKVMN